MKRLSRINEHYDIKGLFILLNIFEYNLKVLHWNVVGVSFETYHKMLEEYYEHIYDNIDMLAEYMVSKDITIPKYGTIASEEDYDFINVDEYSVSEAITICQSMFENILIYVDNIYDDLDHGIQSKLDEMYFYYDKELNYKLKQKYK